MSSVRAVFVLAAAWGAGACASIAGLSDYEIADGDASLVEAGPGSGPGPHDAAADSMGDAGREDSSPPRPVTDGGCFTLKDDFDTPNTSSWIRLGDAKLSGGAVTLAELNDQRGAIVVRVPDGVTPGAKLTLTATLILNIAGLPPGDGFTAFWSSDESQPPIGNKGGDLAFCPGAGKGPKGAAIGIKVFPPVGMKTLESTGTSCSSSALSSDIPFGGDSQKLELSVTGKTVAAKLGSSSYGSTLKADVPMRWIGISAATGDAKATFRVDDVSVVVCP